MRKRFTWILALGAAFAVLGVGAATAYKPVVIKAGNLVITANGGISPTALPKSELAPVKANIEGSVTTSDGSHTPAATRVIVDVDKNFAIDAKGLPVCKQGQLEASTTAAAKKACPNAIIGSGTAEAEVEFPESSPFKARGPLVFFNGGVKGGATLLLIHFYASVPAPTAIITPVKISKVRKGHYGIHTVSTIPVIAGGSGSIIDFRFTVNRKFSYKGKPQSYLKAKCPTGQYYTGVEATFTVGPLLKGTVVRPCTPKG